ncbi:hypothetical protein [Actinoplanes sp. TFC3]|uniref:hypothetical protein n=1 Tax=Actinoplanes sp. TFC3 TaxID=1710355 RepID=UPI0009EB8CE0|nr:hypothetical protein [Actinoplanes sp. TFC3]
MVTISSYLLYLAATASLIAALLALTTISTVQDVYGEYNTTTNGSTLKTLAVAAIVGSLAINVLFSAGLVILAIFNNRGRQGSRITTWVIGGIFLCCSGFGLLGNAATRGMNLETDTSGPSQSEIESRLSAELPGWYGGVTTTLTVLVVLALLGALILLALPAANNYFRKPQGSWNPAMPYPGYPPQYPYPSAPQYPQHPQQPQHPQHPPAADPWSAPPPQQSAPPPQQGQDRPPTDPI